MNRRRHASSLVASLLIAVAACSSGSGGGPGAQPLPTLARLIPIVPADAPPAAAPSNGLPVLQPPGGGKNGGNPPPGFGNLPVGGGNGGTTGAPDWVRPGMRISWYVAAASVAQSRYSWVEDPTGPWEDPTTGKRYRRTDEDGGGGQPGASGDGVSQIDVLAVEGADVVLSNNVYVIDRSTNPPRFIWAPGPGARVAGNVVDGAWMSPGLLAQYLGQPVAGVLVLRGPYNLNGTTFQAVSFVTKTGAGSISYTYDAASGILLSANTTTAGATSPIRAQGEAAPQGNTQLTITRFLGMRQREVPGTGRPRPDWTARLATLQYAGNYNITNPIDPSSGSFNYPMQYVVSFAQGGRDWLPFSARSFVNGLGDQPEQTSVSASTGRFWFDPAALAAMQPGQVLDQDPTTGEQLVVVGVQQGGGGSIVTIDTQLPGVVQRTTYDGRGLLVVFEVQLASTGTTIHLELQSGP